MHPKQTEYNRASQQRKREAGLVRVELWVHETQRDAIKTHADALKKPRVTET